MCQALLEIMEPEINKIKENVREEVTREVTKKVTREVRKRTVAALRICGEGDAAIKKAIMEVYGISASEAEEYL